MRTRVIHAGPMEIPLDRPSASLGNFLPAAREVNKYVTDDCHFARSMGYSLPLSHMERQVEFVRKCSYINFCLTVSLIGAVAHAQSVKPGAATSSANISPSVAADPNSTCAGGAYTPLTGKKAWLLPLNRNGAEEPDITCFFASNGIVSPLTQVNFLYGFGSSSSTISADLVSGATPLGFEVSLGSSLSGSSSNGSSGSPPSSAGQATPQQAIQQLQNGGDFYVRGIWPLLYGTKPSRNLSGFVAFVPRLASTSQG
jgi:hypothetical protein